MKTKELRLNKKWMNRDYSPKLNLTIIKCLFCGDNWTFEGKKINKEERLLIRQHFRHHSYFINMVNSNSIGIMPPNEWIRYKQHESKY